ncbi:MAG: hypothetical protein ACO1PM_20800 [Acidovorax sp.]
MNLQSIRPSSGADLHQLKASLDARGEGWESALPAALPDELLLGLARDFRDAESELLGEGRRDFDPSAVTLAVLTLVMRHPERSEEDLQAHMTEGVFQNALYAYQWAVEREIVSRIVGHGAKQSSEQLLAALRNAAVGSSEA